MPVGDFMVFLQCLEGPKLGTGFYSAYSTARISCAQSCVTIAQYNESVNNMQFFKIIFHLSEILLCGVLMP